MDYLYMSSQLIGNLDKFGHIIIIQKDIDHRIFAYLFLAIDQN